MYGDTHLSNIMYVTFIHNGHLRNWLTRTLRTQDPEMCNIQDPLYVMLTVSNKSTISMHSNTI